MIKFTIPQFKTLSNFCNDIAKGVFLGMLANQLASSFDTLLKLLISLVGLALTFTFLCFALIFSREKTYDY